MNSIKPILLFSTERSGTNLLRAILSSHSEIASPPASGIINVLAKNRYKYQCNTDGDNCKELISDAIRLIDAHPSNWDINFTIDQIKMEMREPSVWEMFRSINELYAQNQSAKYWLSKEPNLFDYGYEIKTHMPDALFIYLVRDGRDVAASMLKGRLHENHIYFAAKRWRNDQIKCLQYISDPLFRKGSITVYYEDLIRDPYTVIGNLSDFIGIDFESSMLEFYKNDKIQDHSKRSEFWKNLSKPIISTNSKKYLKNLNKNQIHTFESVASDLLKILGYQLEYRQIKSIRIINVLLYYVYNYLIKYKTSRFKNNENKKMLRYKNIINEIEYK